MPAAETLSDMEYSNLYNSLQQQEQHVCSRMCEFKQVFGNMFYCVTSGQAHVCDQNCNQRIFYDNHHDICRLSKRVFPRGEIAADIARKRSNEQPVPELVKRAHSADWRLQQQAALQGQSPHFVTPQQQELLGVAPHWA